MKVGVFVGIVVGVAYGVALRGWMRLVSTEPEFSWSGTGYIVGVFAVLGGMAGLATVVRRRGWARRLVAVRVVGIVLSLGCFLAAGIAMAPTIIPAAIARARARLPWPVRLGLAGLALAAACFVLVENVGGLSPGGKVVASVVYLGLCCVEVEMLARLYAPRADVHVRAPLG